MEQSKVHSGNLIDEQVAVFSFFLIMEFQKKSQTEANQNELMYSVKRVSQSCFFQVSFK